MGSVQSSTAYKIKDSDYMPEKQHPREPENSISFKKRLFVQPGSAFDHTILFTSIPTAFTRLQKMAVLSWVKSLTVVLATLEGRSVFWLHLDPINSAQDWVYYTLLTNA